MRNTVQTIECTDLKGAAAHAPMSPPPTPHQDTDAHSSSLCVWLLSPHMMAVRCTHEACFCLLCNTALCESAAMHCFSPGCVWCFQLGLVMTKVATTFSYVTLRHTTLISVWHKPGSGMGISRSSQTVFQSDCANSCPHQEGTRVLLPRFLAYARCHLFLQV